METQFLLRLLLHMILSLQCEHLVWNKFHFSAVAIWISVAYIWQWNVRPFWSTVSVPESISQTKHASNYAPQMLTDLEWYHLSDVLFFSFRSLLLSLFTAIPDALLFFVPFTLPFRSVPFLLFFALFWTASKKPFKRDQPKALGQYSYTITMASSNSLCTCFIINNLLYCLFYLCSFFRLAHIWNGANADIPLSQCVHCTHIRIPHIRRLFYERKKNERTELSYKICFFLFAATSYDRTLFNPWLANNGQTKTVQ